MRAADRTCAAAGAEAAVSGLPGPRVVVTATNALLRVVFQRLGSRGLEGVAAWQSPWKRVHFRRAVTSVSFMQASLPASFLSPFSGLRLWKAALLWYRVVFGGFFCFLVLFARSHKILPRLVSGTPCHGYRPQMEVPGLRFAELTCVPRLRGLFVLGKPGILFQCWFDRKSILTPWLRKQKKKNPYGVGSRCSPCHCCVLNVGLLDVRLIGIKLSLQV